MSTGDHLTRLAALALLVLLALQARTAHASCAHAAAAAARARRGGAATRLEAFAAWRVPSERPPKSPLDGAEVASLIEEINSLQDYFARHTNPPRPDGAKAFRRAFHAKGHCVKARLEVLESRPARARHGVFAAPRDRAPAKTVSYPAWVRWSNGLGVVQHDLQPDVRGMAVKVFPTAAAEQAYERAEALPRPDGKPHGATLDLLATNGPTPTTQTAPALVEFLGANRHAHKIVVGLDSLKFLSVHPHTLDVFLTSILPPLRSYLLERYWSGSPYKLGPETVKFNLQPDVAANREPGDPPASAVHDPQDLARLLDLKDLRARLSGLSLKQKLREVRDLFRRLAKIVRSPDYLQEDAALRVARRGRTYTLNYQFYVDAAKTPVEDLVKEWKEADAPSVAVARLVIPRQPSDAVFQGVCENAKFNPGNVLPGHGVAGFLNQDRVRAYAGSGNFRAKANAKHDL